MGEGPACDRTTVGSRNRYMKILVCVCAVVLCFLCGFTILQFVLRRLRKKKKKNIFKYPRGFVCFPKLLMLTDANTVSMSSPSATEEETMSELLPTEALPVAS